MRAAGARRPTPATGSAGPSGSRASPRPSAFPARPSSTARRSVVIEDGRTNFSELQAALAGGRPGRIEYYAFDLLYLDRYDLRAVAQIERKRLLKELFDRHGLGAPLHYSEHIAGNGGEMVEHAAKLDWEGIVSKNPAAPYQSDRNEGWIKVKTAKRGSFPVVGFVKDPTGVAALYLGRQEGGELVYMGKVGTRWSRTTSSKIRKQLDTAVTAKSRSPSR
jgi:bifunctional non-homologous end joining protein LigD